MTTPDDRHAGLPPPPLQQPDLRLIGGAWRSLLWTLSAIGGTLPFGRLEANRDIISISLLGVGTGPIERHRVQRIYRRRVCYFRLVAIQHADGSVEPLGFAGLGQWSILQQLAALGWPADLTRPSPLATLRLFAVEALVFVLDIVVMLGLLVGLIALVALLS